MLGSRKSVWSESNMCVLISLWGHSSIRDCRLTTNIGVDIGVDRMDVKWIAMVCLVEAFNHLRCFANAKGLPAKGLSKSSLICINSTESYLLNVFCDNPPLRGDVWDNKERCSCESGPEGQAVLKASFRDLIFAITSFPLRCLCLSTLNRKLGTNLLRAFIGVQKYSAF